MKYTEKFTLELKMSEFYLYAIPKCSKPEIKIRLKNELYQSWHGIVDGEWGGIAIDWKGQVYKNLFLLGMIEQTQHCKDTYGDWDMLG